MLHDTYAKFWSPSEHLAEVTVVFKESLLSSSTFLTDKKLCRLCDTSGYWH
jgi:hypothetical protein